MKNLKLLSLCVLVLTLVFNCTFVGYAIDLPEQDIINEQISEPTEMSIYDMEAWQRDKEELLNSNWLSEDDKKILRGDDFGYGSGLDSNREIITYPGYQNIVEPQWKGGGRTYTHQYITRVALIILSNDLVSNPLNSYTTALAEASDLPDKDENDYAFSWHFYDPDTGKNYNGGSDTALSKLIEHYNQAVRLYNNNNVTDAIEELGRACHYVEDLSEPHHASNKVAVVSKHTQFEEFCNTNRSSYGVTTMGTDSYNYGRNNSVYTIGRNFAIYAKSKINLAENTNTFAAAAEATIPKAQKNTACLLYKFMIDTGLVN